MKPLKTASFALGCFWGPEARFGGLEGVVRTCVGYAGGEKENPTYHDLGEHTETVQLEFDPSKISFRELLEKFWSWHDYTQKRKTQYRSIAFYHTEEQRKNIEDSMPEDAVTEIMEMDRFWIAEDYHQKYRLRNSKLMEKFQGMDDEELRESPEAAKANAVAAGYLAEEELK